VNVTAGVRGYRIGS